ncbi:MAG: serine protease [Chitinophagaceae bacterium]|jgi:S1-C subfamily serine protease|nr:serine protease [Chitinophagaceae bacterium]
MDQILLLEAAERYLRGEMNPEEKRLFEEMRKNNPEVDQLVVEHQFFLEEMDRYGEIKRFKATLYDTHHTLQENGEIKEVTSSSKGKIAYLWNRYRRVVAVAASIAGITALLISGLTLMITPKAPIQDIEALKRQVNLLEKRTNTQDRQINDVRKKIEPGTAIKFGGTSFLVDPKGYLVTSAHVIQGASRIFLQNSKGQDFHAEIIYTDEQKDLAILKIDDEDYRQPSALPYGISKSSTDLAESVFTLGYPKDEIVYGEGYLSAKTGLKGDTMAYQISIAANPGNSGGPILNEKGEVIGILNARQTAAEGVVFAVKARNIVRMIDELKKKDSSQQIKISRNTTLQNLDRVQQVKKITDCIYMVKVVLK